MTDVGRRDDGLVPSVAHVPMVAGVVQHGDARGRTIGFPTANLCDVAPARSLQLGVYAAWADVHGVRHRAAVNVGVRPTVYGRTGELVVEAHLLDFDADIYGVRLTVWLVERIRGEQRFEDIEALTDQLRLDVRRARDLLASDEL